MRQEGSRVLYDVQELYVQKGCNLTRFSTLPWVLGLTTSTKKVGSPVYPSGVPLRGGQAHQIIQRIPDITAIPRGRSDLTCRAENRSVLRSKYMTLSVLGQDRIYHVVRFIDWVWLNSPNI